MAAPKYFRFAFGVEGNITAVSDTAADPVVSYEHGFTVNYEQPLSQSGALPVPRPQFNQLLFDATSNLQYWQQNGIYPWIPAASNGGTAVPYGVSALCTYDTSDGNGVQIWRSLAAANTATPGSDPTKWTSLSNSGVPVGTIIDFAGATAPFGYVTCNGTEYAQSLYPSLFSAIGLAYGTPSVGTNFLVPDLRRFTTMGMGGGAGVAPGVTGTTVGSKGGSETHVQVASEVAGHIHPVTIMGDHSVSGTGYASLQANDQGVAANAPQDTGSNNTGAASAMNITQPTMVVNKCIRAF